MDMRNLEKFLSGRISPEEIVEEIDAEVGRFRIARLKKGASSPVYGINEDFDFILRKEHLMRLCSSYIEGRFNESHLEYLCNLIEMSDAFSPESDDIEDAIFEMSSPEIHSPLSPDVVENICRSF